MWFYYGTKCRNARPTLSPPFSISLLSTSCWRGSIPSTLVFLGWSNMIRFASFSSDDQPCFSFGEGIQSHLFIAFLNLHGCAFSTTKDLLSHQLTKDLLNHQLVNRVPGITSFGIISGSFNVIKWAVLYTSSSSSSSLHMSSYRLAPIKIRFRMLMLLVQIYDHDSAKRVANGFSCLILTASHNYNLD